MKEVIELLNQIKSDIKKIGSATKDYLTLNEAAEYTGYCKKTIRHYKDEIGYIQRDKKLIFKREDIETWLNKFHSKR